MAQKPKENIASPLPEELKFYGQIFATLTTTDRKAGTLREKNAKRAGLTKGTRIAGHFHPDADSPSLVDIPLVVLDVHHEPIQDLAAHLPLSLLLDGITGQQEAVNVLQDFSRNRITPQTRADYVTFIREAKFNALSEDDQRLLLNLPTEVAIIHPRLAHLFLPALCQALVWRGFNSTDWIGFLKDIGVIDGDKAYDWRELRIAGLSQSVVSHFGTPEAMQQILDYGNTGPNTPAYRTMILGQLGAYEQYREAISSRYVLVPCRGEEEGKSGPGHAYAISDQAANGVIVRWVDEQEAEELIMSSDQASWDQKYRHTKKETNFLYCSQCAPKIPQPRL